MHRVVAAVLIILAPGLALAAAPKPAAPTPGAPSSAAADDARYQACLTELDGDANAALDSAEAWTDEGGGTPARHCASLALVALGRYTTAAKRLAALAEDRAAGDAGLRAALYAQAGNAWLLGGDPRQAYDAFTHALALTPSDEDVLFDRARASASAENFRAAASDLDRVLAVRGAWPEALILRATARRETGDLAGAASDADQAVTLASNLPEAWLERGLVRHAQGQRDGAIADWRHVLEAAPKSDAGVAAQRLIEQDALGEPDPSSAKVRVPLSSGKAPPPP